MKDKLESQIKIWKHDAYQIEQKIKTKSSSSVSHMLLKEKLGVLNRCIREIQEIINYD